MCALWPLSVFLSFWVVMLWKARSVGIELQVYSSECHVCRYIENGIITYNIKCDKKKCDVHIRVGSLLSWYLVRYIIMAIYSAGFSSIITGIV